MGCKVAKISNADLNKLARSLLLEKARSDFPTFAQLVLDEYLAGKFVPSPFFYIIAWRLQQASMGGRHRLAIAAPPRHGKSLLISVLWPAFLLGLNPEAEILCASYVATVAEEFGKAFIAVLHTKAYREIFPAVQLKSKTPSSAEVVITKGGIRRAVSVGGYMTGVGADYLLIDDPLIASKNPSENALQKASDWLRSTALNRLNVPAQSVALITQQRLSPGDLVGDAKASGGWDVLELPAIATHGTTHPIGLGKTLIRSPGDVLWPGRFPVSELDKMRLEMGDGNFEAQYQQMPVLNQGAIFDLSQFKRFQLPEIFAPQDYDAVFLSMDPAVKGEEGGAKTAITLWGVKWKRFFLLDAQMANWGMPEQLKVLKKYAKFCTLVLVEHCHTGIGLIQWLEKEQISNYFTLYPGGSKEERAQDAATFVNKNHVFLPYKADWLEMVETALAVFPAGYADLIDSMTQFLNKILRTIHPRKVELPGFKEDDTDIERAYRRKTSYYARNGGSFPG